MVACVLAVAAAVGCGGDKQGDQDTGSAMQMMDSTRDTSTINPTDTLRRDSVPGQPTPASPARP
jgi:hypothetical protein